MQPITLSPRLLLVRKIAWIALIAIAGLVVAAVALIYGISTWQLSARHDEARPALRVAPAPSMVREGWRLAHTYGCIGCHGDLTGHVFVDRFPIGRLAAPNLTRLVPNYSDAQIERVIRGGVKADGTSTVFMPSHSMVRFADADVAALIAYLRTVKPRPDANAASNFGPLLRALIVIGEIPLEAKAADRANLGPAERPVATLALGKYLTNAVCADCHGADLRGGADTGAPDLVQMTLSYTLADFKALLSTGRASGNREVGLMSEVSRSGFKYFRDDEVAALHAYLTTPALAAAHQ